MNELLILMGWMIVGAVFMYCLVMTIIYHKSQLTFERELLTVRQAQAQLINERALAIEYKNRILKVLNDALYDGKCGEEHLKQMVEIKLKSIQDNQEIT